MIESAVPTSCFVSSKKNVKNKIKTHSIHHTRPHRIDVCFGCLRVPLIWYVTSCNLLIPGEKPVLVTTRQRARDCKCLEMWSRPAPSLTSCPAPAPPVSARDARAQPRLNIPSADYSKCFSVPVASLKEAKGAIDPSLGWGQLKAVQR